MRTPGRRRINEEADNLFDYAQSNGTEGIQVASTSYRGLSEKSERWHREISANRMRRQWIDMMTRQGNQYRVWTSAITQPIRDREYTITPLCSEHDLYQESIRMEHCVISYGPNCADQTSRIFSVERNGKRLATSEIRLNGDEWQEAQTRGPHNHPVNPEITEVMKRTARRYNQEYHRSPEEFRKFWHEDYRPEEKKTTREHREAGPPATAPLGLELQEEE